MALRSFERMSIDFLHENPDYEDEIEQLGQLPEPGSEDHLFMLLLTPYDRIVERLKVAALELKKTVVAETWGSGRDVGDFTLYSGALATAFLLWKSFQVTDDEEDLRLCSEIVKACDYASVGSRDVSFLHGRAGVCALGAVVAKAMDDTNLMNSYISKFKEIHLPADLSDGLMYGRAGYLWACLFINKHLDTEPISPLKTWNGKKYWGAAHGVAGILNVLMHFKLTETKIKEIKETLMYMIQNRFPSGNYRTCEEDESDVLVHWCHGAPGIALTLLKAAKVFDEKVFLQAAVDASKNVVWERGLLKHVGMCHGISGNGYVFRAIHQLTGDPEFQFKAKSFTCFLLDRGQKLLAEGKMRKGDHPFSLFEGIGGMAYHFLDMLQPSSAKFPAFEF